MTREDAQRLVQTFMQAIEQPSEGLNPQGFGGAMLGEAQLYFEYHSDNGELEASALIYKFREAPKPGILEGFRAEEKAGTDTGGGKVDFEPENKSLFLSRSYTTTPADTAFKQDMEHLVRASLVWGDEVLDRVASRVFPS
ncbi:MAG TPA: type III secretion system chaperone [Myxococcaceae bacterium]|nr:type III secretion system chaperone [Myxococcaceae bacterium]